MFALYKYRYIYIKNGSLNFRLNSRLAPDVLHYPFKGKVQPKIEKNWPNIYFEVNMQEKMAPSADAHKKSSKEMCDAN